MIVKAKYCISDKVRIIAVDIPATVVSLTVNGCGYYYGLEYWLDGELRRVDQSEYEIELIKPKKGDGNDMLFSGS